jgi:hypothetical protein
VAAIDKAILCHFLFDDKDFLRHDEHQAFLKGWNLENVLVTVCDAQKFHRLPYSLFSQASQGLASTIFETLFRRPSLTADAIMRHVHVILSAPPDRLSRYRPVGLVFRKRLARYLAGAGHPSATRMLVAALDPPSPEERVIPDSELRCYYFLKAVTNYRTIPAVPDFKIQVMPSSTSTSVFLMMK